MRVTAYVYTPSGLLSPGDEIPEGVEVTHPAALAPEDAAKAPAVAPAPTEPTEPTKAPKAPAKRPARPGK